MATGRTVARSKSTLKNQAANLGASLDETIEKLMGDAESIQEEPPIDSSIENQLAQAKSSRSRAENARQQIANEILGASKEVCQKLIADGEQTLERVKRS
jgi:hypothetical protein